MPIIRQSLVTILSLAFICSATATTFTTFSCPSTYRNVQIGDNMAAVRAACGEPTKKTTRQEPIVTPINTIKWIYTTGPLNTQDKGMAIPVLQITFREQQIIKIERNNSVAGGNNFCVNSDAIKVGDTQDAVLSACGRPNIVNSEQDANNSTKDVVEWVYNFGPYKPQIILNFEGGVVTQMMGGALGS